MTAKDILTDWADGNAQREALVSGRRETALRWLSEAQLRFVDKSEILQEIWTPTIGSSGNTLLPDDFLREIEDRVKWQTDSPLKKIDHPTVVIPSMSSTSHYSIWGGKFYVWAAAAGTPTIPYLRKPAVLTINSDLEIPTEHHSELLTYMDAMWLRAKDDFVGARGLIEVFDVKAKEIGVRHKIRRDGVPRVRASRF